MSAVEFALIFELTFTFASSSAANQRWQSGSRCSSTAFKKTKLVIAGLGAVSQMAASSEGNPLLQERLVQPARTYSCLPRIHGNMILVAVCAAVSGFCFGYDIGIIDQVKCGLQTHPSVPPVPTRRCSQVLAMGSFRLWSGTRPGIDPDAAGTTGWIVSTFLFGCIGGSLAVSYLADAIGRKRSSELRGTGQAQSPLHTTQHSRRRTASPSRGAVFLRGRDRASELDDTRGPLRHARRLGLCDRDPEHGSAALHVR